jgi:hypothetical protein
MGARRAMQSTTPTSLKARSTGRDDGRSERDGRICSRFASSNGRVNRIALGAATHSASKSARRSSSDLDLGIPPVGPDRARRRQMGRGHGARHMSRAKSASTARTFDGICYVDSASSIDPHQLQPPLVTPCDTRTPRSRHDKPWVRLKARRRSWQANH